MNAADFELNVFVPVEGRFATTMRDLATHAARYAGCPPADAERYGSAVERVVRECLERAESSGAVPIVLRRGTGPVEFLIGCGGRFDAATHDDRITVAWIREQGRPMCIVSLDV